MDLVFKQQNSQPKTINRTTCAHIEQYAFTSNTPKSTKLQTHNAALRCEQRYHQTKPIRLKHETQRGDKNAKRWESLLNALLSCAFQFSTRSSATILYDVLSLAFS
ncbi:hypothetical protein, partial [Vibrio parahaemolyticus]|uniref:hypothetical protein n=1 Tax=Vibrio parahaemolyticus TaxID=670 RepID=UPI001C5E0F1E